VNTEINKLSPSRKNLKARAVGIIPARFASTRFPGKPLVEIAGKTMVMRVYEQAKKASSLADVVVATDDERILNHVWSMGGNAVMTSNTHVSGTDRCAEAVEILKEEYDVVVNIQGDEPFQQPSTIDAIVALFDDKEVQIASVMRQLKNIKSILNPNRVKVVFNRNNDALYFSRQPIPYEANGDHRMAVGTSAFYLHVGMYAFRASTLKSITALEISRLEALESLEQLRWLENGYTIRMVETLLDSPSVDVPEDLEKLTSFLTT